jgi:hypothetical protein
MSDKTKDVNGKDVPEDHISFVQFAKKNPEIITAHGQMPFEQGVNAVINGLALFNRPAVLVLDPEGRTADDYFLSMDERRDTSETWVEDVIFVLKEGAKEMLFFLPEPMQEKIIRDVEDKARSVVRV